LLLAHLTHLFSSIIGLVGGLFAPTLFFGGMLGALFHNIFAFLLARYGRNLAELPAYAMIGSASFLAAVFRAPLTGSLILFECTREYDVILPLMASAGWASVVADVLDIWKSSSTSTNATVDDENEISLTPTRSHDELDLSVRKSDDMDRSKRKIEFSPEENGR
jgi:H+/Cl- antiporter ClcA